MEHKIYMYCIYSRLWKLSKNQILWYKCFQIKFDICLSIDMLHGKCHNNQPVWDHRSAGNWVPASTYLPLPSTYITQNQQQNVFAVSNHKLTLFSGPVWWERKGPTFEATLSPACHLQGMRHRVVTMITSRNSRARKILILFRFVRQFYMQSFILCVEEACHSAHMEVRVQLWQGGTHS